MKDTKQDRLREDDEQNWTDGTRRRFLQRVSAVGGAFVASTASVSRVTASPSERATADDVQAVLDDPKVQSLLDSLDSPRVLPHRAAARSADLESQSMEITIVPTVAGDIVHGTRESGETQAHLRFESIRSSGQIPEQYRSLPNADSAILKGLDDGVVLTRLATERELSAMVNDLDINPGNVIAFTSSERDEFTLKYLDADDEVQTHIVDGARIYSESTVGEFSYREVTPSSSNLDEPTTMVDCSTDWCWRCAMASGGCGACVASCSAVGPGCALCLMAMCGASGFAYSACVDCNT